MKLNDLQGIIRASLALAIGYLEVRPSELSNPERLQECEEIVGEYLYNNGLKFDYSENSKSYIVVRRTVLIARRQIANQLTMTEALVKLEKALRIQLV